MTKPTEQKPAEPVQELSPQMVRALAATLVAITLHGRECYGRKIKASDVPALSECFRKYIEGA